MKVIRIFLWLGVTFFVVFISSCTQTIESAVPSSSETPSLLVSSVTLTPSFTLSTDSPTSTIIPTLPVEEARAKLLKLLSNNSDCRLPCLWEITPDISTNEETQAILVPFSSISDLSVFKTEGGGILPAYSEGDLKIYIRLSYITDPNSDLVNHVTFNVEAHRPLKEGGYEEVFDSKFFGEKASSYMLPHVLSEQGVPSSVMIATSGGPLTRGGTGGFDILLLYPDQGILVNYTTQMHLIGTTVRGCPPNAHVEMELYPPGQSDSFSQSLKKTDWAVKMGYYKPLEEVTTMSTEEFYQTFREPTDKCIETLAKLWPVPEP